MGRDGAKDGIRRRLRFYGQVQGVGLRWRARHAAGLAGATGWVRNEPDGSVSMEIQGSEAQIDAVIGWIQEGRYLQIHRLEARDIPFEPDERGFAVLDDFW